MNRKGMNVIRLEGVGKKYLIGHDRNVSGSFRNDSFREMLQRKGRAFYQRIRHPLSMNREQYNLEEFWALKEINLEVREGERLGIIGHNGAGKTTMLKLLSRITAPSEGWIGIRGRIASLLEVGTGFHPELSGRENIYLNGAILGMKRVEIREKFDEIVAFSGVEKFIDTPVKRYSSGMYVRLAFAVAAHLEPEILVIDEVLAVGDASFQQKSLGKMRDFSESGRTVLFVSHNMGAVFELTDRTVYLKEGKVVYDGEPGKTIEKYMEDLNPVGNSEMNDTFCELPICLTDFRIVNGKVSLKKFNTPLTFIIGIESGINSSLDTRLNISNSIGHRLITTRNILSVRKGMNRFRISLENHFLPLGAFVVSLGIMKNNKWIYTNPDCFRFTISDSDVKDNLLLEKQDRLGIYLPSKMEKE